MTRRAILGILLGLPLITGHVKEPTLILPDDSIPVPPAPLFSFSNDTDMGFQGPCRNELTFISGATKL